MKPFREIHFNDVAATYLHEELESHGYVLIRNLLPAEDVQDLLNEILEVVSAAGWLSPLQSPSQRIANESAACGESDAEFEAVYNEIFALESFHALAHHSRLRGVMQMIVGPRLLVHPKPIGRLIFPNCDRFVIHAHQDHLAIGGHPECYTAWMPLHDCPPELGPLQILEGSHRFGMQSADPATGMIPREVAEGHGWASGQINGGDVLIFHGLTVHSASPNISDRLRVSIDCRFQDYVHAFDPANIAFTGTSGRSWESTYEKWRSTELQYFWKRIPMVFKPSLQELAELAETAPSARMRLRYSKILSQVQLQMEGGRLRAANGN